MVNSKSKGSSFERLVCEKLSLWITHGEKRDCFWRSAMSGGRATVGRKAGKDLSRQAGDISSVSPEGHALTDIYYIECKSYRSLDIAQFMLGKGKLFAFWKETRLQARKHGRKPLLIAKQDRFPILMITRVAIVYVRPGSMLYCLSTSDIYEIREFDKVLSSPFNMVGKIV